MEEDGWQLLRTDRRIPLIGFGTWQLEQAKLAILYALHAGFRMIDTSADYGTQTDVGEAIETSGIDRNDIYVITKVEEYGDSYEAIKSNLKELNLSYANLVLIHRPPADGVGIDLWRGLIQAYREGLTKDIGVSNYPTSFIDGLVEATHEVPSVNQIEWSPFGHSEDMLRYCHRHRILIQAYSPLTRIKKLNDANLINMAEKYGVTTAQLILRFDIQLGVCPIVKANKPLHIEEDIDVFGFEISDEDMEELWDYDERFSALDELAYE